MKHTLLIKDWLSSFLSLLFPRCCVVCGRPLAKGEECICTVWQSLLLHESRFSGNKSIAGYHLRTSDFFYHIRHIMRMFFHHDASHVLRSLPTS